MSNNKINKKYTDFSFKFTNLKESNSLGMDPGANIWVSSDQSVYSDKLLSNNRLEILTGLSLHAVFDNLGNNAIIVSPGACDITNPATGNSKLHFVYETLFAKYEQAALLEDGSDIIDNAGFLFLYALFNESTDELLFRFSNIEPVRSKDNRIPPAHSGLPLYHPNLPARCIGFIPVGQYHNSSYGAGVFHSAFIAGNRLVFPTGAQVYSGSQKSWYDVLSYHTPPTRVGGFPICCNAVNVTVWGNGQVRQKTVSDPNLDHIGTHASTGNKHFQQVFGGSVGNSNGVQCTFYLHRAKTIEFRRSPDTIASYGLQIDFIEIAR